MTPKTSKDASKLQRKKKTNVASSSRLSVPVITLLTDFGCRDYFIGAVKGAIFSVNPSAQIVDITHDVAPQDIEEAAFTLLGAYDAYPAGTVHVAVVDPGVGSSRKPILIEGGQYCFVGPDNGIFSYVCESLSSVKVFHLNKEQYFRRPVSQTFNGRDVFAPIAAALSTGVKPEELGTRIPGYVKLRPLKARVKKETIEGRIIHVDRFGNCVTNLTKRELPNTHGVKLSVNGRTISSFRNYFSEDTNDRSRIFAVWGSAGFLEIAAKEDSASKLAKLKRGDLVMVTQK